MISLDYRADLALLQLSARAINPLSRLFQRELGKALDALEARCDQLRGVIVSFRGAAPGSEHEIEHLLTLTAAQAGACQHTLAEYNALLRRLERLPRPVLARVDGALNGHVLGLALACHQRLALADASVSLPQVQIGLSPVAGEIARCVRLAGLQAALPLLLEGLSIDSAQARAAGLFTELAGDAAQLDALLDAALATATPQQPWDVKGFRLPGGALGTPAIQQLLQTAPAMLRARTGAMYPAPEAILCAAVEGLQVDFDNAVLIESRYFCHCATGAVAKNLMRLSQGGRTPLPATAAAGAALLADAARAEWQALQAEGVAAPVLAKAAAAAGLAPLSMQPMPAAPAAAQPPASPGFEEVRERLLFAQSLAALRALAAGQFGSAAEADQASVALAGFPAWSGGVISLISNMGSAAFARRAAGFGPRFSLPAGWEAWVR